MEILHMLPFILQLHFKEKVCIIFQYGTTVCNSESLLSATVFVLKAPFFSASSNEGADEQKVKQRKPHKFNLFSRSVKACTLKPLSDKESEPYFLFTSILFLRFSSQKHVPSTRVPCGFQYAKHPSRSPDVLKTQNYSVNSSSVKYALVSACRPQPSVTVTRT